MRKLLLCAVMLFGTVCMANAQDKKIQFGVRAGMNINSLSGEGDSSDSRIGYHVGAIMDWNVAEKLYVQPGLFFTTRGGKVGEVKTNKNYLQVPISVSYRFPVSDNFKIDVNAGPYFAFGIGGKVKGTSYGDYDPEDYYPEGFDPEDYFDTYQYEGDLEDEFGDLGDLEDEEGEYGSAGDSDVFGKHGNCKRFDAGLRFGAGVHFNKFSIGLIYDLGLVNTAKHKGFKEKNNSFQISLGYNF